MPDHHAQRIGFAGTPEFAHNILSALLADGVRPKLVLTAPDRPKGRGRKLLPTPVRELASSRGIPVLTPISLKQPDMAKELAAYALDLLIVVAYGVILPPAILHQPRLGCLNVHPSLLPRWRGAAPIERAIMAGDSETGVCIMKMDEGLDTGPIFDSASLPIREGCTGDELREALAELASDRLLSVLRTLPDRQPQAQAITGVTYANKIASADQEIDWTQDAHLVARQIHALNSAAPAFSRTTVGTETLRVRILKVQNRPTREEGMPGEVLQSPAGSIHIACRTGYVSIIEASVLRGAGRRLSARELANGFPAVFRIGRIFF